MLQHQVTHDPLPAPLDPPGEQGLPGSPYNLTAEDTELIITVLTPNTNYNITVCAFTSVGCGPLSSRVNQTDEDGKTALKFAFSILYDCIHFFNSSPGSHQSYNHLIKKHIQQQYCNYSNHMDTPISAQRVLQLYAHILC